MANRAALRAEVRELIGGGIYDNCFDDSWANEGLAFACDQIAAKLGLTYARSANITVLARLAPVPADAMVVNDVRTLPAGEIMGRMLMKSSRFVEDMKNPLWRDRNAEPTIYIEETGASLRLNGTPASNAVIIGYMQRPTPMVDDDDTPDARIPETLHPYLKYAAAAFLLQLAGQGQDMEKANDFYQKFGVMIGVGPLKLSETEVDR